jgi:hypothetical protein
MEIPLVNRIVDGAAVIGLNLQEPVDPIWSVMLFGFCVILAWCRGLVVLCPMCWHVAPCESAWTGVSIFKACQFSVFIIVAWSL